MGDDIDLETLGISIRMALEDVSGDELVELARQAHDAGAMPYQDPSAGPEFRHLQVELEDLCRLEEIRDPGGNQVLLARLANIADDIRSLNPGSQEPGLVSSWKKQVWTLRAMIETGVPLTHPEAGGVQCPCGERLAMERLLRVHLDHCPVAQAPGGVDRAELERDLRRLEEATLEGDLEGFDDEMKNEREERESSG